MHAARRVAFALLALCFCFGIACDETEPTTALPTGLDLAGLLPEHRALLRATIAISDGVLSETDVVINDDLSVSGGVRTTRDIIATTNATLTLRVYGRFNANAEEVVLGRMDKPITLERGQEVGITFDDGVFDSCDADTAGRCSVLFDENRNGASNIDDLLERTRSGGRGIDPAPQAPALETSSEQLQFPSGVRLGTFARQLVVLENFGDNALSIESATIVGGQGFAISILDPTGLSIQTPGRTLDGADFPAIQPGQEAFVAVSFAPVNAFITTGALFVRVKDTVTLVEQTARVKLIANPEKDLRPADPLYTPPTLVSVGVDGGDVSVSTFPATQLANGEAVVIEDVVGRGLRQTGARLTIDNSSFPVDAAFAVSVRPGERFSTTIDGLVSDIDLALVEVNDAGAITGLACDTCVSQNAGVSPEAVELKNDTQTTRNLVVLLGRVEASGPPEGEAGALTVARDVVSFRCATTVTSGPEFDADTPVSPTTGPLEGGVPVTLRGAGFHPLAKVFVGQAQANDVVIVRDGSDDTVTFTLPAAVGTDNPASIIVENPSDGGGDGQAATLVEAFTYQPPAPVIDAINPDVASTRGSTVPVSIDGRFFSARHGPPIVNFGGVDVEATFLSAQQVLVTVPARTPENQAATINVRVRNRIAADDAGVAVTGSSSNALSFRYLVPAGNAPTLTSIAPAEGSVDGNTNVTLTGADFRAGMQVFFGGRRAFDCNTETATSIACRTPAGTDPGAIDVSVTNNDGQSAQLVRGFTYAIPAPSITSVFPAQGSTAGGTLLIVDGGGFRPGARATFTQNGNERLATAATRVSGTTMLVTTPTGAAGAATLTIKNLDGQSVSTTFTYIAPAAAPPVITALSPATGDISGGNDVVISGTGFSLAPTVVFGTHVLQASVQDNGGVQELIVQAPSGTAGAVTVQVINADGQSATATYTYVVTPAQAPLVIQSRSTETIHARVAGDVVTLFGSGFDRVTSVTMTGQNGATPVRIVSASAAVLVVEIGAAAPGQQVLDVRTAQQERASVVFTSMLPVIGIVEEGIFFGDFFNPRFLQRIVLLASEGEDVTCAIEVKTNSMVRCLPGALSSGITYEIAFEWRGVFGGAQQAPTLVTLSELGIDDIVVGDAVQLDVLTPLLAPVGHSAQLTQSIILQGEIANGTYEVVASGGVTGTATTTNGTIEATLTSGLLDSSASFLELRLGRAVVAVANFNITSRVISQGEQSASWPNVFTSSTARLPGDEARVVAMRASPFGAVRSVPATIFQGALAMESDTLAPGRWRLCFSDQLGICEQFSPVEIFAGEQNFERVGTTLNRVVTGVVDAQSQPSREYFFIVDQDTNLVIRTRSPCLNTNVSLSRRNEQNEQEPEIIEGDYCDGPPFFVSAGEYTVTVSSAGEFTEYSLLLGAPNIGSDDSDSDGLSDDFEFACGSDPNDSQSSCLDTGGPSVGFGVCGNGLIEGSTGALPSLAEVVSNVSLFGGVGAGVAIDRGSGLVFFVENQAERVSVYDIAAGVAFPIPDLDELSAPRDIEIGPDGALYIAELTADRVSRFEPGEGSLSTFVFADGLAPVGLAFDPQGALYVASAVNSGTDTGIRRITDLGGDGAFEDVVEVFEGEPHDIQFDTSGRLFIASGDAPSVRMIDDPEEGTPQVVAFSAQSPNDMATPHSLAFDAQDQLWVSFYNSVIQEPTAGPALVRYGPNGFITQAVFNGSDFPNEALNGFAFDASGALYGMVNGGRTTTTPAMVRVNNVSVGPPGETCDDDNPFDNDGCDASCFVEANASCVGSGAGSCVANLPNGYHLRSLSSNGTVSTSGETLSIFGENVLFVEVNTDLVTLLVRNTPNALCRVGNDARLCAFEAEDIDQVFAMVPALNGQVGAVSYMTNTGDFLVAVGESIGFQARPNGEFGDTADFAARATWFRDVGQP